MANNPIYDEMMFQDAVQDSEPFSSSCIDIAKLSIGDSNGGSYSQGQITYDLTALSTSDAFVNLRDARLMIPVELKVTNSDGTKAFANSAENAYSASMRNSVYSLIDSFSFSINGTEVISAQPNSHLVNNYKILTEWSPADLEALGPSYGFAKDSTDSLSFSDSVGEMNTRIHADTYVPGEYKAANTGRQKRSKWQCVSVDSAITSFQDNTIRAQNLWMGTCAATAQATTFQFFLIVPLKGLHNFFEVCPPLMRKMALKLVINTNLPASCTTVIVPATGVVTTISSICPRGTLPFQITPHKATTGTGFVCGDSVGYTAACKIGNASTNQSLFLASRFTLSAEKEIAYLADSVKTIRYTDYFSNITKNVSTSQNNIQIGSAMSNIRRLVVLPILTAESNKGTSPLASPYSTAGTTTAPFWWCSNLNVAVSGQNLFSQNLAYRYDQWANQEGVGSLNGGYTNVVRSGLINAHDFSTMYGAIDINLARHPALADDSPQIITLTLTPQAKLAVDLHTFVFYERSIKIDVNTGALMA